MAAPDFTMSKQFLTALITTAAAKTLQMRDRWAMAKNLGANAIQISNLTDNAAAAGNAVAAGDQTSCNPVPATGQRDTVMLKPFQLYSLRAATADTLIAIEEIGNPKASDSGT